MEKQKFKLDIDSQAVKEGQKIRQQFVDPISVAVIRETAGVKEKFLRTVVFHHSGLLLRKLIRWIGIVNCHKLHLFGNLRQIEYNNPNGFDETYMVVYHKIGYKRPIDHVKIMLGAIERNKELSKQSKQAILESKYAFKNKEV